MKTNLQSCGPRPFIIHSIVTFKTLSSLWIAPINSDLRFEFLSFMVSKIQKIS